MLKYPRLFLVFCFVLLDNCSGLSSPIRTFSTYEHSVELEKDIADLWWRIDDAVGEITFEFHVKTTGWIGLGISPGRGISPIHYSYISLVAGGMKGADIAISWVDSSGELYVQVRFHFQRVSGDRMNEFLGSICIE